MKETFFPFPIVIPLFRTLINWIVNRSQVGKLSDSRQVSSKEGKIRSRNTFTLDRASVRETFDARGQDETIINRNKYRRRLPRSRLCAITRLFRKERADGTFSLEFPSNPNAFQSVYIMPSFRDRKTISFLLYSYPQVNSKERVFHYQIKKLLFKNDVRRLFVFNNVVIELMGKSMHREMYSFLPIFKVTRNKQDHVTPPEL